MSSGHAGATVVDGWSSQRGAVDRAVSVGTNYLRSKLAQDGHVLRTFGRSGRHCRTGDGGRVFAAFFLCEAIAEALSDGERARILSRIDSEERDGVWGYSPGSPVDADDTTFALRTAGRLGRAVHTECLNRFVRHGVHTTFLSDIDQPVDIVNEPSIEGNRGAHPEVLANIYTLYADTGRGGEISSEHIHAVQNADGSFPSFFYPSRYYSTWMFARLVHRSGCWDAVRERTERFLRGTQNRNGSWGDPGNAYETALAVSSLAPLGVNTYGVASGMRFLVGRQDSDGSWYTPQPIWVYRNPEITMEAYDANRVVTTALAIQALKRLSSFPHEATETVSCDNTTTSRFENLPGASSTAALSQRDPTHPLADDCLIPIKDRARELDVGVTLSEVQDTANTFRERFDLIDKVDFDRWMAGAGLRSRAFLEVMFEQTLARKLEESGQNDGIRASDAFERVHEMASAWQRERQARGSWGSCT